MAREHNAVIGSGTIPFIGHYVPSMSGAFPNGRYPQEAHEGKLLTRMGTGSIILNFEDASIFIGIGSRAISVSSSAVPLPTTPLESRRALAIHNAGPGILYIGNSGVTTANGFPLAANEKVGLDITGNSNVTVYGVSDSTSDVRILELA